MRSRTTEGNGKKQEEEVGKVLEEIEVDQVKKPLEKRLTEGKDGNIEKLKMRLE